MEPSKRASFTKVPLSKKTPLVKQKSSTSSAAKSSGSLKKPTKLVSAQETLGGPKVLDINLTMEDSSKTKLRLNKQPDSSRRSMKEGAAAAQSDETTPKGPLKVMQEEPIRKMN